ncbi:MAG TPA: DUF5317 family protein [Candidatus Limnocylindria bacterium]|nr:DUF5317 family protein [Candidatus Limnocylindria bacterium]
MLASAVVLGVVSGAAFGGDLRRLGRLSLRGLPVLLVAAAIRALGIFVPLPWPAYVAALLGFGIVAVLNRELPGALLIAAGIALNVVVITLNAGMPVDQGAAASAGAPFREDGLHVAMGERTVLAFLGDVLPMPLFRNVYSVGDVVLAAGGFWLPFRWLRQR